ncbi:hypothetical protein [Terrihabitans sp. B22-R8]|uniref:hypothetical protein n=1 Tax=Terrihabitans sp. B22-R8 TaxID=3425128 RepID=UPI00403D40FD
MNRSSLIIFASGLSLFGALPLAAQEPVQPPAAPAAPVTETAPSPPSNTPFTDPPAEAKADSTRGEEARDGGLAIETDILIVRVLGPWSQDDKSGFSRAVGRVTEGNLELFVQWISDEGEIVQTRAVEQDAETPQLALASVRSETGDDESAAYFDTPEDNEGFRETFVLIVGAPGQARFGPATN